MEHFIKNKALKKFRLFHTGTAGTKWNKVFKDVFRV